MAAYLRRLFYLRGAAGLVRRFGCRQVLDAVYELMERHECDSYCRRSCEDSGRWLPAKRFRNPGGFLVWYLEHGAGRPVR